MSSVEILPGARATEARLLELVGELRDEARRDPRLLARPARIVVPSRSLRLHVAERITGELGSVAGVAVQTLHGVALEILERAGESTGGADFLVEVLARRFAREERALAEVFDAFRDGYRTVSGSVRDLLDAGFEPALADAVVERLRETSLPPDERRRAAAVVATAARVAAALAERGVGGRAALLSRAREVFEADPERALPARQLVVHGFADATGRASDLLEAFVRRAGARVLVDHPSDPDEPSRADLGCVFSERLVERLGGRAPAKPAAKSATSDGAKSRKGTSGEGSDAARRAVVAPVLELFRAPGAQAEVRAVARSIRALVQEGVRPERIGVVARDLSGYRAALRRELGQLGVSASALRARAPVDGPGRAILALVELVEQKDETPTDRWLDAVQRIPFERDGALFTRRPSHGLRLGLRVAGAARLRETAELDLTPHLGEHDFMRLPVCKGVETGRPMPGDTPKDVPSGAEGAAEESRRVGFKSKKDSVQGFDLRGAVTAAAAIRRRLARWPERAAFEEHLAELARLRRTNLGWRMGPAERRVRAALDRLAEGLAGEELTAEEFALLVRRSLVPAASPPLGGEGGGVAVLDAMEARARTFEHLFVLGVNRDVFPRVVREDPLLGDDARRALQDLLPDVPLPSRGRDEDRYLFAQLLSSSPSVTVSWQLADDDGKRKVVSPLVERCLREQDEEEVRTAPPLHPLRIDHAREGGPRTAQAHAVLGGLHRERRGYEERLELALAETLGPRGAVGGVDAPDVAALARTRGRVLDAFEDGPRDPERLAPYLGFLGAQDTVGIRPDPRVDPLYVTRYEGLAKCPWQAVLTRFLRLEQAPDPLDALPGIDKLLIGNVAHKVIERLVERVLGKERTSLDDVLARDPVPIVWPEDPELFELCLDVARRSIAEARAPVPGLVRMIAECVWPHLQHARAFDRAEAARFGDWGVLGAEVTGRALVARPADGDRAPDAIEVFFRADRVEKRGDVVVLTDFKTGKQLDYEEMVKGIPAGKSLQPLAYALGAAALRVKARGRYLFLAAQDAAEMDVGFAEKAHEYSEGFGRALGTLADAWSAGTFFPRLADVLGDKEADACRLCHVAQACLRGDSGARRAVVALGLGETTVERGSAELGALWRLPNASKVEKAAAKSAKPSKGTKRGRA